ncbi:MAG: DNA topoisomerase IB [Baekduia sp.]
MPRLRRSDCSAPGIARVRRGRGFSYQGPGGQPVTVEDRERIASLAIPPAWTDVWVCLDERGHMQATGIDAAGRKQYLYHPKWREHRDRKKFDAMLEFAEALPRLRWAVRRDLGQGTDELGRDRVLAAGVRLLDRGLFRVGSEQYAEDNGTHGLATVLRRHVSIGDGEVVFDYPAKSGVRRVHTVADPDVVPVIERLKARRGGLPELLAFRDGRRWVDVRSTDINDYIRDRSRHDCSAKDFRTWNATVLAAAALAAAPGERGKAARERVIGGVVKDVAAQLGNTPAVCRSSYIDPRVFDRYRSGSTIAPKLAGVLEDAPHDRARRRVECAVVDLLG